MRDEEQGEREVRDGAYLGSLTACRSPELRFTRRRSARALLLLEVEHRASPVRVLGQRRQRRARLWPRSNLDQAPAGCAVRCSGRGSNIHGDREEAWGLVRHRNRGGGWRQIWVMGWRIVVAAREDP